MTTSEARTLNSQRSLDADAIEYPPNLAGELPPVDHQAHTRGALKTLAGPGCDRLLRFYCLPVRAREPVTERRERLRRHFGLVPF